MIIPSDRVYTLGPEYSFSDNLARKLYPNLEIRYLNSNSPLVEIASEGEKVLVAIENSIAGIVGESLRKIREVENIFISREIYYPISLCLGGIHGSEEKSIKEVYSHQKALEQSSEYLGKRGIEGKTANSTAEAIKIVKELDKKYIGVIASEEGIIENGLKLFRKNIQNERSNYSIFWELSNREVEGEYTSLIVDIENHRGTLYNFLEPLKDLNLYSIHSWPENGNYWFLMKIESSIENIPVEELKKKAKRLRVLGSYNIIDFR